jgi:hypothetical protein
MEDSIAIKSQSTLLNPQSIPSQFPNPQFFKSPRISVIGPKTG